VHQIEQERSDLQRNLVQTSSQFDQLSSEKYGLTIALDELRGENNSYDYNHDLICFLCLRKI